MKRCDMTDLPVDQCAGACCRPDLAKAESQVEKVRVDVRLTARYDTPCDKAEALREAADDWYGDDGPWDDHGSEATWLRERADKIEGKVQ